VFRNYLTDNEGNNENNDDSGIIITAVLSGVFGTMCLLEMTFVWQSIFS
jgi:hypothetical protein